MRTLVGGKGGKAGAAVLPKPQTMDLDADALKQFLARGKGSDGPGTLRDVLQLAPAGKAGGSDLMQPGGGTTLATLLAHLKADASASVCLDASEMVCDVAQYACSAASQHMAPPAFCANVAPMCAAGATADGWAISAAVCLEKSMPMCDVIMKACSDKTASCPAELVQYCQARTGK